MTKYKTESSAWRTEAKITAVEIDRESESSVWVKGNRLQKVTQWHHFHDSWEAAQAYLISEAERKVEHMRRSLEVHKSYLGNIKGMKKPAQASQQ